MPITPLLLPIKPFEPFEFYMLLNANLSLKSNAKTIFWCSMLDFSFRRIKTDLKRTDAFTSLITSWPDWTRTIKVLNFYRRICIFEHLDPFCTIQTLSNHNWIRSRVLLHCMDVLLHCDNSTKWRTPQSPPRAPPSLRINFSAKINTRYPFWIPVFNIHKDSDFTKDLTFIKTEQYTWWKA